MTPVTDADIRTRARSWCDPIGEGDFAGTAARTDDRYQELLVQLGRLQSVHDEACDWDLVYRKTDELLRQTTKDMTLLGALCAALLERESVGGLAVGLRAYQELVTLHAAELHPRRKRGRANAFGWLTARLEASLGALEPRIEDHAAWRSCCEDFARLDELLRAEFAELHPRVGAIRKALGRGVEASTPPAPPPVDDVTDPAPAAEEPAPVPAVAEATAASSPSAEEPAPLAARTTGSAADAPPAADTPPATPAPAVVSSAVPAGGSPPPQLPGLEPLENEAQAQLAVERVVTELRRVARFYLEHDATRAEGYQSAMIASHLGVVPDGRRAIQGPSPKDLRQLSTAVEQGDGLAALRQLPDLLSSDLTLNVLRQLARALELAGEAYRPALLTVLGGALGFYVQHDGLVEANPDTLQWLEVLRDGEPEPPPEEVAVAPAEVVDEPPVEDVVEVLADAAHAGELEADAQEERLSAIVRRAEQAAARDGIGSGCLVLQQALERTARPVLRFHLRLALAQLCAARGAPEVALPVLRALYDELAGSVREWDPQLLVDVVAARLGALRATAPAEDLSALSGDYASERDEMQRVLALVDPERAVRER